MKNIASIIAAAALALAGCAGGSGTSAASEDSDDLTLLVGSYSEPGDSALGVYSFNPQTGVAARRYPLSVANASFLAISGPGMVYAACESDENASTLTALSPDSVSGEFQVVNSQAVGSAAPCYVNISPDGRFAVTANYTGGTVAVFPIAGDGSLLPRRQLVGFDYVGGTIKDRQESPHPHCIAFTPDGRYMLVDDLGNDRIHQFSLLAGCDSLVASVPEKEVELEPGSGPRHLVFNRRGDTAYLINELSDKVTVLSYDGETLVPRQYIAADTVGARGAADIHISPDGKHLYASLRLKHDGVALFDIDPESGLLTYRSHTSTPGHPRNFTISPDGRFMLVACRDGNVVKVFEIAEDGSLTDTNKDIKADKAVFVSFYP